MVQIMGWNLNLKDFRNTKRVEMLLQQIELRDKRYVKLANELNATQIDLQAGREVIAKLQDELATYKASYEELARDNFQRDYAKAIGNTEQEKQEEKPARKTRARKSQNGVTTHAM